MPYLNQNQSPKNIYHENYHFELLSIKCVKIPIISSPFGVSLTLSNSSKYIIGLEHFV